MDPALEVSGPWDFEYTVSFLGEMKIPIRVASGGGLGPIVQSLWFDFDEGALWCATQANSVLVKRLSANNQIGFEISGDTAPYIGSARHRCGEYSP